MELSTTINSDARLKYKFSCTSWEMCLKSIPTERHLGVLVSSKPCQPRGQTPSWGASDTASPASQRWPSHCSQHWCGLTTDTEYSPGSQNLRRLWWSLNTSRGRQQSWRKTWEGQLSTLGFSCLESQRLRCDLTGLYRFLWRGRCWLPLLGIQGENIREQYKAVLGEIQIGHEEEFLY